MKQILFSFFILITANFSFGQTLTLSPGRHLSANDPVKITFELDSIIKNNTYPLSELESEPIRIQFTAMNLFGYGKEFGEINFIGKDVFWGQEGKEIQLVQEEGTHNIFLFLDF